MELNTTFIIILITVGASIAAWNNESVMQKLIFSPTQITHHKQYYRLISSGVLHGDVGHLAFNMLTLYMFGSMVESSFALLFGTKGTLLYCLLYVTALVISLLPTYFVHKHNSQYLGLGASGAVSAIIFTGILLFPTIGIGLFFIPIFIPGFIFGPIYLGLTYYLDKRGGGNINHSAHLYGALYGIAFTILMSYALTTVHLIPNCITEIKQWLLSKGIG